MKTEKQTLEFNSVDMPLNQFIIDDGFDVIVAPNVLTEEQMRREALKYMGRVTLDTGIHAAKATGEYLFWLVTRHYPGE